MISLKCRNCGGEMSIDLKGELACPYCGSKQHISDPSFQEYKQFRLHLLQYLRSASDQAADAADGTFLWEYHDTALYHTKDGKKISIDYLFYAEDDGVKMYVAKTSVIFVFGPGEEQKAQQMLRSPGMLEYPSAAIKDLSRYFPVPKSRLDLEGGGTLIAVNKPENVYPLFAFGSLRGEHVAWIVSRMENFCCVFEFSAFVHNGISIDSVFINPRTHEAFLLGGWWKGRRKAGPRDNADLKDLRRTADRLLGPYREEAPALFRRFLSTAPAADAYSDFGMWDEVIEKGFGGHHFTQFQKD